MKRNRGLFILLIATTLMFSGATMIMVNKMRTTQKQASQEINSPEMQENNEGLEDGIKYVVRALYKGENPGKEKYRFFAVHDDESYRRIFREELPENIKNNSEKVEVFGSEGSNIWYVELSRFEDLNLVDRTIWKETDPESNVFVTWYNWTDNTEDADDEEIKLIKDIAGSFREMDPEAVRWKKKNETGLVSFMVVENAGDYLVKNDIGDVLYRMDDKEGLVEVIRCPDGGAFDYCWFL